MSVVKFIRSLDSEDLQQFQLPEPESVSLDCRLPRRAVFPRDGFGDELHETLTDFARGEYVPPAYYAYFRRLGEWLENAGVVGMHPDWECYPQAGLPGGRLDALLRGGPRPRRHGVLELKSAHSGSREGWRCEDALQAAVYASLLRAWGRADPNPWIVLAYIAPGDPKLRIHYWVDSRELISLAERLARHGCN